MVAFEVLPLPLSLLDLLHNIVEWINLSDSLFTELAEILVAQHVITVDIDSLEELGYLRPRELKTSQLLNTIGEVVEAELSGGFQVKKAVSEAQFLETLH